MNIALGIHGLAATAIEIRGTAAALHELRRRGALVGDREWCPYFDQWTTSWMIPARPRPPARRPRRAGLLPVRLDLGFPAETDWSELLTAVQDLVKAGPP